MKVLVTILWVLDFLHFFMTTHAFYYYGVTNYMNPVAMSKMTWSLVVHVLCESISDAIVRGIFSWRIWKLSGGNKPLVVTFAIIAVAIFAGGIAFSTRAAQVVYWGDFEEISSLIYYSLGTAAGADVLMSATLCYYLSRRRSSFRSTQSLLDTLVVFSINAGVFTSTCALACVISYATMPNNFIFQAFYYPLPKLLLNSLMAMMNARPSIRDAKFKGPYSIPLSGVRSTENVRFNNSQSAQEHNEQGIEIQINTTLDQKTDPGFIQLGDTAHCAVNDKRPKHGEEWLGAI
ncbi:hypothetical protein NLI96_g5725 [Meripilus lineatus]|uniref:DUF6534 domain-containing protein n=1 Tax=Meripilus lineatus TaxID=2056292 RepID=A0AAD5V7U0_9APHY|nr:hypothetical protein NLI96_g5725 [Physisporinus lineatus]